MELYKRIWVFEIRNINNIITIILKVNRLNFRFLILIRLRKKHKYILAEITSSECFSCCKYEMFYHNLMEKFIKPSKYLSKVIFIEFKQLILFLLEIRYIIC